MNSLISKHKRHFFNLFLIKHKPDIVLVAEHKLSSKHNISFKGYNFIRQDRTAGIGGGTAICIKEKYNFKRFMVNTNSIENTILKLSLLNGSDIYFVACYCKPSTILDCIDLNNIISSLNSDNIVFGGDFNAKHSDWGNSLINSNGRRLYDWLGNNPQFKVIPTKFPSRIVSCPSFIDFFITSPSIDIDFHPDFNNKLRTLDVESDHFAVELPIILNNISLRQPIEILNYNKININTFNLALKDSLTGHNLPLNRNCSISEIDDNILVLNNAFNSAIENSVPKIKIRNKGQINLSQQILDFIKEKRNLRRTFHRCFDIDRKNLLKAIIRNLDKIIKELIINHETEYWNNYFRNLKMNNMTYKKIKGLCGLNKKCVLNDLISPNGDLISDSVGKVNLLAEHFCNVHKQNLDIGTQSFSTLVKTEISQLNNNSPIIVFNDHFTSDGKSLPNDNVEYKEFINRDDIKYAILCKNNKKSSGFDGVSNFVLRKTDSLFWNFLAILFNHAYNIGYFPSIWKCAKVIPVHKPNSDSNLAKNYRPISLLSNISKVFEFIILRKINDHILNNPVLKNYQFGFRRKHSTVHGLTTLSDFISTNLNNRSASIILSLDFEKAFDTAWQEGIIYKMLKTFVFNKNVCRFIFHYLSCRTFYVNFDNLNSIKRDVLAGVPQGSLLGPILYNIYLADIPDPPVGENIISLIYADDILIASSNAKIKRANILINSYTGELTKFFDKWKLKLNINKCLCSIIKGKKKFLFPNARKFIPCITINNELVSYFDKFKYLGVIFQESFTFYRHIDYILDKAQKSYFSYSNFLRRNKMLKSNIKLNCYKQIIRPILAYAYPIWFSISSHQMERLRIFERKILKICSGLKNNKFSDGSIKKVSNKNIYKKCKMKRIDNFLINSGIKFLDGCINIDNILISRYLEKLNTITYPLVERYYSPIYLKVFNNNNAVFNNSKALFYHRRFNSLNIINTVYNTYQFTQN